MEAKKNEPAKKDKKPQAEAEPKTVAGALQITQIALDSYEDIFSDFDPSPFEKRLLSEDFIKELRRHYAEGLRGEFMVSFTLPRELRSEKKEALVKKRIKEHFKTELRRVEKEKKENTKNGVLRISSGLVLSLLIFTVPALETLPVITMFSVLSWFLLWSGYEQLFDVPGRLRRRQAFYEKFLKAECRFVDEEKIVKYISSSYR